MYHSVKYSWFVKLFVKCICQIDFVFYSNHLQNTVCQTQIHFVFYFVTPFGKPPCQTNLSNTFCQAIFVFVLPFHFRSIQIQIQLAFVKPIAKTTCETTFVKSFVKPICPTICIFLRLPCQINCESRLRICKYILFQQQYFGRNLQKKILCYHPNHGMHLILFEVWGQNARK